MDTTTILRVKIRTMMMKAMEVSATIYNSALLILLLLALFFTALFLQVSLSRWTFAGGSLIYLVVYTLLRAFGKRWTIRFVGVPRLYQDGLMHVIKSANNIIGIDIDLPTLPVFHT